MNKRWFTPSFESSASAETGKETSCSKRRRTKNARSVSDQRETRSRQFGGGGTAIAINDRVVDVLSKYEPETPNDLVVHVKKVEQVRAWIENRIADRRAADGKYLLLHGPPGSGKSTTFRVLAKSYNVQIIEWITPLDREQGGRNDDDNDDECDYDYDSRLYFDSRSATDLFDSFLWRASRYSCLASAIVNDRLQQQRWQQQQQQQQHHQKSPPVLQIILVKDFPHSFAQNAQPFHNIMRKYRAYDSYPIAFVCNDDALCRNLFPEQIRDECGVHDIVFNAVNCSAVTKALKRLLEVERRRNPAVVTTVAPDQLDLQSFHQQSGGDLRRALLKFYFSIVEPSPSPSLSRSNLRVQNKTNQTASEDAANDHGLDLFKLVGRILYCKRETLADGGYKFVHDPEQLVKRMLDQPRFFVGFLRENYVSRFQDMVAVASAADTLCVADVALRRRCCQDTSAATSDAIALSCLVRRLMVSNRRPNKSFAPFVKPKTYDSAETLAARLSRSVRNVFPHLQLPASELVLYVLPFARFIPTIDAHLAPHLRQVSSIGNAAFSLSPFSHSYG